MSEQGVATLSAPQGESAKGESAPGSGNPPKGENPAQGQGDKPEDIIAKLQAEVARYRGEAKSGAAAIERLAAIEEAQKSDSQKAAEALAKAQSVAAAASAEARRLRIALSEGVPSDLIDFIGDGDDEQILSRAKRLAQLAKAEQVSKVEKPAVMRPIEDLKPGAMPSGQAPADDSYPAHWLPKR